MQKATAERIEKARRQGIGTTDWCDWTEAPVSWNTLKKYTDIFETKHYYDTWSDDYEEWTVEYKLWRFR